MPRRGCQRDVVVQASRLHSWPARCKPPLLKDGFLSKLSRPPPKTTAPSPKISPIRREPSPHEYHLLFRPPKPYPTDQPRVILVKYPLPLSPVPCPPCPPHAPCSRKSGTPTSSTPSPASKRSSTSTSSSSTRSPVPRLLKACGS